MKKAKENIVFTISGRIRIARHLTKEVAEMKDWRIRNKRNRLFREKARELMKGKGYLILTQKEAHQIDSDIEDSENPKKIIWGIGYNDVWNKIGLTPC